MQSVIAMAKLVFAMAKLFLVALLGAKQLLTALAATCTDGSAPGANGCCADTGECPPCCLSSSLSASGSASTCSCSGCEGDAVIVPEDFVGDCSAYLGNKSDQLMSGMSAMGCNMCFTSASTYLWPRASCQMLLGMGPAGASLTVDDRITCAGAGHSLSTEPLWHYDSSTNPDSASTGMHSFGVLLLCLAFLISCVQSCDRMSCR